MASARTPTRSALAACPPTSASIPPPACCPARPGRVERQLQHHRHRHRHHRRWCALHGHLLQLPFVSAAPTVTVSPATIRNAAPPWPIRRLTASGRRRTLCVPAAHGQPAHGHHAQRHGPDFGHDHRGRRPHLQHSRDRRPRFRCAAVPGQLHPGGGPPTLTLAPAAGTLTAPHGVAYSQAFTAAGGSGSYTYALGGTRRTASAFSGGTLSGTPTAPGSYPITVTATDSVLTGNGAPFHVTQAYTLDVGAGTPDASEPARGDRGRGLHAGAERQRRREPYTFSVTAGSLPSGSSSPATAPSRRTRPRPAPLRRDGAGDRCPTPLARSRGATRWSVGNAVDLTPGDPAERQRRRGLCADARCQRRRGALRASQSPPAACRWA